ncbi:MAG TPA: RidA family protein [Longimicrobiales bacterium]|jgi:2-iminobutanoate/2-iminopropanoate deaminase
MSARLALLALIGLLCLPGCSTSSVGAGREAIRPAQGRPYSQAVRYGDTYYLSGKVGATGQTRAMTEGRAAAEVRNIMESFRDLLTELGLDFGDVVMATVFLTDIADYSAMNDVYAEYFPANPPARETVAVRDLVGGAAVEISFIVGGGR